MDTLLVLLVLHLANVNSLSQSTIPECPQNQTYQECNKCIPTCTHFFNCQLECMEPGCYCDRGYVYSSEKLDKCITYDDCCAREGKEILNCGSPPPEYCGDDPSRICYLMQLWMLFQTWLLSKI